MPLTRGERRLLTILFCDLVGSTALATRLDPEDLREVLATYYRRVAHVVGRAGGTIEHYEGDGIVAYFGHPAASEDDAERAVAAGLALTRALVEASRVGEKLSVRVGIATGIVVVGERPDYGPPGGPAAVGQAPHLAARLQALAEPNSVVICSTTQRLVGGLYEYQAVEAQAVKGFGENVRAWRVVGATQIGSRFEALRSQRPLLGREQELAQVLAQWQLAKAGAGRVVVIRGEAGIGKSRLIAEVLASIRDQLPILRSYYCSPLHVDSMLYPILARLQRVAMFDSADGADDRLQKLESVIASGTEHSAEIVALLADLLALPPNPQFPLPPADGRQRREALFAAFSRVIERLARHRPLVLLFKDVHWIDPTTRELVTRAIEQIRELPVLFVLTTRPGPDRPWLAGPHVTVIDLGPIDTTTAANLVGHIQGAEKLGPEVRHRIVGRADGIPLFLEELTRAAIESGEVGALLLQSCSNTLPTSLRAPLMSRLDRLGWAREVAKVASALGREFTLDLLSSALPDRSLHDLRTAIDELASAEILVPVTSSSEQTFAFRHALVQDAAYDALLRNERKALHARIAAALQSDCADAVAMHPEILARHLTRAELYHEAVGYWLIAGKRAVGRSALLEARELLSEGLRVCRLLPPSPGRARLELDLQMALGPVMMATRGYAASESLEVFSAAERLVGEVGTPQERRRVLIGLYNVHFGRAELEPAMAAARQYMLLAEHEGAVDGRAYTLMGQTHAALGNFPEARSYFERALAVFAEVPEKTDSISVFGSQHVISLAFVSGVYFAMGQPDRAELATRQSIELARSLRHPMSIALALVTRLLTPIPGGLTPDPVDAEATLCFCTEHGLRNFEVWTRFAQGAICARRDEPRRGIAMMHAAIEAAEVMCSRLFRPVHYATIAATHMRLAEYETALRLLDDAVRVMEETGERRPAAALHRLLGETLVTSGSTERGISELTKALTIARGQQAKSEELRIEKSLAKLGYGQTHRSTDATSNPFAALRSFLAR